jgi:hypothetical protein
MGIFYKHTQIGYVILIGTGAGILFILYLILTRGSSGILLAVLLILIICALLFASLTIEVDRHTIDARFGPGIIRKSFRIDDVQDCKVVGNPWYYGWGIRLTPHGWLYNVSGAHAVEIEFKSGKKVRLGTDDPDGLNRTIKAAIGEYYASSPAPASSSY